MKENALWNKVLFLSLIHISHFPLDESKLPFPIPKDAQPREKILKLGRMITDRIPAKLHGLTADVYKRQAQGLENIEPSKTAACAVLLWPLRGVMV